MRAYYNEYDKNAAAWLRELIANKLIADGDVDDRSITDVTADDLAGYTQHHFFAGIGGWSYALRLAGVPDDYPVWTASLPCQPFSLAGKQLGKADERHLLPHFLELVRQCKPDLLFGEQVTGAIRHGWLDDLQTTMEAEGYAVGHCVLGAHSVGAFHQRQRLYWVADGGGAGLEKQSSLGGVLSETSGHDARKNTFGSGGVAYGPNHGRERGEDSAGEAGWTGFESVGGVDVPESLGRTILDSENIGKTYAQIDPLADSGYRSDEQPSGVRATTFGGLGEPYCYGREARSQTTEAARHRNPFDSAGWVDCEWLYCRDNKYRPIKPGLEPLVDGLPRGLVYSRDSSISPNETGEARAIRLKGYGNAIVPQAAAEFIGSFFDIQK